ncbi:HNH endonuclease [bacterium 210820-DFI.6.37]|nr:HNH endonuclease [bacterium 210820-DFI.6.37]
MQLPENKKLNTQGLARIFDNMSESYKIFWFKAMVEHIAAGELKVSFEAMINNMIKNAWYMVSEFRLNLGPSDTLEKAVKYLSEISGLKSSEKPEIILQFLDSADDKRLLELKRTLSLNVPYRLQVPFMPTITSKIWRNITSATQYINMQDELIYQFSEEKGLSKSILIKDEWADYIKANLGIITGWIDYNLITYLQRRNPSVPGISNKIYPPQERNLTAVKAYWKAVITASKIQNIYTGEPMTMRDVSIDHFIPWSYVAHDELWNLVPTTKGVNSSKNNRLPKWDIYFPRLCNVEYSAYQLVQEYDHMKDLQRAISKCMRDHVNDDDVRYRLYGRKQTRECFSNQLRELLLPAYESAKNLGFAEWSIE